MDLKQLYGEYFKFFISLEERSKQARDDFKFILQTEANKTRQWPLNQCQTVRKDQIKPEEHVLRTVCRGLTLALRFCRDYASGVIVSSNSLHPQFIQISRPARGLGLIQLGKNTGGERREMWTSYPHACCTCTFSLSVRSGPWFPAPISELGHGAHVGHGVPSAVCAALGVLWQSRGVRGSSVLVSKAGIGTVP